MQRSMALEFAQSFRTGERSWGAYQDGLTMLDQLEELIEELPREQRVEPVEELIASIPMIEDHEVVRWVIERCMEWCGAGLVIRRVRALDMSKVHFRVLGRMLSTLVDAMQYGPRGYSSDDYSALLEFLQHLKEARATHVRGEADGMDSIAIESLSSTGRKGELD